MSHKHTHAIFPSTPDESTFLHVFTDDDEQKKKKHSLTHNEMHDENAAIFFLFDFFFLCKIRFKWIAMTIGVQHKSGFLVQIKRSAEWNMISAIENTACSVEWLINNKLFFDDQLDCFFSFNSNWTFGPFFLSIITDLEIFFCSRFGSIDNWHTIHVIQYLELMSRKTMDFYFHSNFIESLFRLMKISSEWKKTRFSRFIRFVSGLRMNKKYRNFCVWLLWIHI